MIETKAIMVWHHSQQDPVDSMAYAAHAISKLLAERKALKAEIAGVNDRLADACVVGAEAIRKVAIDVIVACESAWNKAPVFGVIGVQTGV